MSTIGRWWRYLGTKIGMTLEASADPKVQLEQAIADAREQHRTLAEQAANVIANQTQLQMRLDRALEIAKHGVGASGARPRRRSAEGRAHRKAADYERAAASYATASSSSKERSTTSKARLSARPRRRSAPSRSSRTMPWRYSERFPNASGSSAVSTRPKCRSR